MTDLGELYFQGLNRPVFANVGDAAFVDATGNLSFTATPPIIPPPPSQEAATLAAPQVVGRSLQTNVTGGILRETSPARMILWDPMIMGAAPFTGGIGVGKLRWQSNNTVQMEDNINDGEFGGIRVSINNGQPNSVSMHLGVNSIVASEFRFVSFPQVSSGFGIRRVEWHLGLWNGFEGGPNTEGAFFYGEDLAPFHYFTRTMSNGVVTEKDTGVLKTTNVTNFSIVKTATGYDFYISGVLVTSHGEGENLPTGLMDLGVEMFHVSRSGTFQLLAAQYLATRGGVFNNA